jgi:hypothetical protein
MSGISAASLPIQRSILAVVLCALAFLFAFEAKLGCYSPVRDINSQVLGTKALRVDAPAVVSHGAPAPERATALVAFSAITLLVALFTAAGNAATAHRRLSSHPSNYISSCLLSPIDFRPPPAQ